jgi:hypothetical protein
MRAGRGQGRQWMQKKEKRRNCCGSAEKKNVMLIENVHVEEARTCDLGKQKAFY